MHQIVEQLKKVPFNEKAHCGIVAQALMIRYCLSEWFGNDLHTFKKTTNEAIMKHVIQIEALMLSEDEIRQRTIHNQAVCIFPTGDNQFYSIDRNPDRLVHKRQAGGMYNSFTKAVLHVFHKYCPDFWV